MIEALEWSKTFGVTLDGLRQRILEKYKNSDAGFKAADQDEDGSLNPAEFMAHCKSVDVGPQDAARLMKEVDKDGDGQISAEEWEKTCEALGIPKDRAADLLKEVDQDGDGQVSEEEYRAAMGMGLEDLKRAVYDKLGSAEAAMEAMDKDGDGVISEEEFVAELKKAGFGEKEAKEMYKELAGEDGTLTAEDWAKATGAEDLEKMREDAGLGDQEVMPGVGLPPNMNEADADGDGKVTEKEFMEACAAKGIAPEQAEELWAAADSDGDGVASAEDLERVREEAKQAAKAFEEADVDGDGELSKEEFLKAAAEKGIPEKEAEALFKDLDANGDGKVSGAEFVAGGGFGDDNTEGSATPPPVDVPDIPMEEVARRVHAAYGTTGEAWEDIAGSPDANHMTPEQWAKAAEGLGLLPEQAEKIYKEMDSDGDGKVDSGEFQKAMGVSKDDLKRRMLKKYGNAEEALKAADADGDGKVSPEEFAKMAE